MVFARALIDNDYHDLFKVKSLENRPKKYIIEYIVNNLDKILKCYIKVANDNTLKTLSLIVSKLKNGDYDFSNENLNLFAIQFIKKFSLAKMEYNQKDMSLKIYMPDEFVAILSKYSNDRKLLEENKKINEISKYLEAFLLVYGIIDLESLHSIFQTKICKIRLDEFSHLIEINTIIDDNVNMFIYDNIVLVGGIEFCDEAKAIEFYEKQINKYKMFTKKDLTLILSGNYVCSLKSYKRFVNNLHRFFYDIDEDIDEIKDMIVLDYISSAQLSLDTANDNFKVNFQKLFEVSGNELEFFRQLVEDIYREYPKWRKRGQV